MMGADAAIPVELATAIDRADVISFDFFDTLFVRPLVDPEDVFDIVGHRLGIPNFRAIRRETEARAFGRIRFELRHEIRLSDIYLCLPSVDMPADQVRHLEVALETELVRPNPPVVEILEHALRLGKKAVVASDMYLGVEFFRDLMERYGLPAVPLFISSDRDATKRDTGVLFELIAAEMGVPRSHVLHIGDNISSDFERAREVGLRSYHYKEGRKPAERRNISPTASLSRGLIRLRPNAVPWNTFHELGFLLRGTCRAWIS